MTHLQNTHQSTTFNGVMNGLELLGGRLCLDFVNTVDSRFEDPLHDWLTNYTDLVQWSYHVDILTEQQTQNFLQAALHHSLEVSKTFERAISLRETMYRVFLAVVQATAPQKVDLDILRDAFAEARLHASLVPTDGEFAWEWSMCEDAFDTILWPIVSSAVELLTSVEIKRVKQCPGIGDCGWLFLDTSKNGSRLWCSMGDCGSRAKMRRQYARKRTSK